jgi:hypothetical protein
MPFTFEREHYRDVVRDFFAWWPIHTRQGWVIWTDVVEILTLNPQSGWETHYEKLYRG